MHILVSDDCIVKQAIIKIILKEVGHTYEIVDDGEEAIKKLESNHYDLLLIDMNMVKMGGLEATSIIRDVNSKVLNHNIPIINISSKNNENDLDCSIKAGMNGFLGEEISFKSIKDAINKVI